MMLTNMDGFGNRRGTETATIVSGPWKAHDSDRYVQFNPDGKVSGFAGCNTFFGTFVATDATLDIGPLGATRKACPQAVMSAELEFLQAVEGAVRYRIDGDTLTLANADNGELALNLSLPVSGES